MEERVQKIMANAGRCSRREAEDLIARGRVRVNGRIIKLGDKADLETDEIFINDHKLEPIGHIYIMLNKPRGYEVTLSDQVNKNILKLIQINERIIPVGRLDKNTSGLLLMTNDGGFANKIMHPRYNKEKTYVAKVDKPIDKKDMLAIREGMKLKDGFVDGKVSLISRDTLEITIHEGRKWIIKRMLFKLGYYVKELCRTQIGNVKLNVKTGKWRFLTEKEVKELIR